MANYYKGPKKIPLTEEEIKERYEETQDEMREVLIWKKEEEGKLKKDNFKTHQAKSSCKRNLKKVAKRIDSVKGMLIYWKMRVEGKSHFFSSIELNEFWASLREKEDRL
jgi:hypothetical protein